MAAELRPSDLFKQFDYREAVEALVQRTLINQFAVQKISVGVISRVRANPYDEDSRVREQAGLIAKSFYDWVLQINTSSKPDCCLVI